VVERAALRKSKKRNLPIVGGGGYFKYVEVSVWGIQIASKFNWVDKEEVHTRKERQKGERRFRGWGHFFGKKTEGLSGTLVERNKSVIEVGSRKGISQRA